jgi:type VI secretion system protein ImpE
MKAKDLYSAGQLTEAIAASVAEVKAHPADSAARMLLCELLCFSGEIQRADRQLDSLLLQEPKAALLIGTLQQLLRAEQARQECFRAGRVPEFLDGPSPRLKTHLEALVRIREGCVAEAAAALAEAEAKRPVFAGTFNGQAMDDFRDLDDLTSSFFEVFTSTGKYFWIPMERVEQLELDAPERVCDLLWRPAHMIVRDGPDGLVYLPALYPESYTESDERLRLGRLTEWRGGEQAPVRGVGLRMFLVGDADQSIHQLQQLTVNAAALES